MRPGYFLGFYFWLDAIATCSLVFEVPTVRIRFFGGSEYVNLVDQGGLVDNAGDMLYNSSKAGRVARVRRTREQDGEEEEGKWSAGLLLAGCLCTSGGLARHGDRHVCAGDRHVCAVGCFAPAPAPQIFRLLRMLRLYSLFQQYERRRRIRAALQAAGQSTDGSESLTIIEFEMQQEQEKGTRVGQKLEGVWLPCMQCMYMDACMHILYTRMKARITSSACMHMQAP